MNKDKISIDFLFLAYSWYQPPVGEQNPKRGPKQRLLDILRPALRRFTAMLLRGQALLGRAEAATEVGGSTFGGQRVEI